MSSFATRALLLTVLPIDTGLSLGDGYSIDVKAIETTMDPASFRLIDADRAMTRGSEAVF